MQLEDFLHRVAAHKPLDTPEVFEFMDRMSGEARRITFELNAAYHTPEEVRSYLSSLFGKPVPATLRVFPPFYTDFGKNITVGENVFINACCRKLTYPAPIRLERGVWVGSNATILQGVTIGEYSIVAAGAVVTRDVPPRTIVGGVPAKVIRHIEE